MATFSAMVMESKAAQIGQIVALELGNVLPVHPHLAAVRLEQAHHVLEHDRLPGTGRADNAQRLTFVDLEGEPPKNLLPPERLVDVVELDAHSRSSAQKASRTRISMLASTTERVAEMPTPAAPPLVWNP